MKTIKKNNPRKKSQRSKKILKNRTYKYKKHRNNKKNITQIGYGRKERERAERKRIEMEREYLKTQQLIKQRFRSTFLNSFNKLKTAIDSNDNFKIDNAMKSFQDGLSSNRTSINTLIPVKEDNMPIDKVPSVAGEDISEPDKVIKNIVPLLVIIFEHIDDTYIKKQITKIYIQNMGNINLESSIRKISALSSAIKIQDKDLVNFLIENGADKNILSDEDKSLLDILMAKTIKIKKKKERRDIQVEEQIEIPLEEKTDIQIEESIKEPIIEPIISDFHATKLVIPNDLPNEYNNDIEPEFWKPLFQENEMITIRQQINNMINRDINIPLINSQDNYKKIENMWGVCQINKALIPTYFVQTTNEPYEVFGTWLMDTEGDFSNYNIILCAALIIFGVITYKMKEQDYEFIIKGGKAIQLVLSNIPETNVYNTEDIDLLIIPKKGVERDDTSIQVLAANLSYLMKWFLNRNEINFNISVQTPDPSRPETNQYIYKLSYLKSIKKKFFNRKENRMVEANDYKPFADIDFKNLVEPVSTFFEDIINYPFFVPQLNTNILFTCPSIDSILDEKIYFYAKYTVFLKELQQGRPIMENGYTKLNVQECYRILDKFKRAILAINNGILKQSEALSGSPSISQEELKSSIQLRFDKLEINNLQIQEDIINSLYPRV